MAGEYIAGWIKRGPSGVIGTNKKCAQETVERLLEDLAAPAGCPNRGGDRRAARTQRRAASRWSTYAGWEAIDAHERGRGEPHGRPRVKLIRRAELLAVAGA